ncbi:MAG: ribonuclease HI [Clostridia bacterium]|nr:ribonuclease HI [Clostridia bacterium]
MKKIIIYTDGACSGNPGDGGWGAILKYGSTEKELSGYQPNTTNNRMELTAVIESLLALKYPCEVAMHCDSAYVVNAINNKWIVDWQLSNWKNASNKPVKNVDLWVKLLDLLNTHNVSFIKVKGHSTDILNQRCDKLATTQIALNKSSDNSTTPNSSVDILSQT